MHAKVEIPIFHVQEDMELDLEIDQSIIALVHTRLKQNAVLQETIMIYLYMLAMMNKPSNLIIFTPIKITKSQNIIHVLTKL